MLFSKGHTCVQESTVLPVPGRTEGLLAARYPSQLPPISHPPPRPPAPHGPLSGDPSSWRVLGIETSCDDTAAAVLSGTGAVLSNVIAPQSSIHAEFQGVKPDAAKAWDGSGRGLCCRDGREGVHAVPSRIPAPVAQESVVDLQ